MDWQALSIPDQYDMLWRLFVIVVNALRQHHASHIDSFVIDFTIIS